MGYTQGEFKRNVSFTKPGVNLLKFVTQKMWKGNYYD